jgi:hypothetical protein
LSRLDRRLSSHPAQIPHANRPGIPARSRSEPLIPARGQPAHLAGGRSEGGGRCGLCAELSPMQATAAVAIPLGSRVIPLRVDALRSDTPAVGDGRDRAVAPGEKSEGRARTVRVTRLYAWRSRIACKS